MSTPAEKFTSRDTDPDISAIDSIFQAQQRTVRVGGLPVVSVENAVEFIMKDQRQSGDAKH